MTFRSILFPDGARHDGHPEPPSCLSDLNLDQIIAAITDPKQEYDLMPFFLSPLRDADTIRYRQEVMQDLENKALLAAIERFAEGMSRVRRYLALAQKLDFEYHRKGWFLEAALVYTDAVTALQQDMENAGLTSRGLQTFRDEMSHYVQSTSFQALQADAREVKQALSQVRYCIILQEGKFKVKPYEGEIDYSIEVENIFRKFQQGDVEDYLIRFPERSGTSHIDAQILAFVARLYPEPFTALDRFCARHDPFLDARVRTFDREIQFYIAYLEFIAELERQGLPFCYPEVSATDKEIALRDGFDLALAHRLRYDTKPVVLNSFSLRDPERILVITGPNQGGKTTFARMFGQVHYLASLGCPVPGREARLFLFDQIFTHFEKEEDIRNLRGKLEDDLVRIHEILAQATPNSILILNEIFASTTLQDALFLSKHIMARVMELDALCVWVTFLDELASLGEKNVSMVATVSPEDPTVRTFKIMRKPADGLAYALSLAHKHRLTYEQIKERLP